MVIFHSPDCLTECLTATEAIQGLANPPPESPIPELAPPPGIEVSQVEFKPAVSWRPQLETILEEPLEDELDWSSGDSEGWGVDVAGMTLASLSEHVFPSLKSTPSARGSVPPEILKAFPDLFTEPDGECLPPSREFDCPINLVPGAKPVRGRNFQLTREEEKVLKDWIEANLKKGIIRPSNSPWASPCFYTTQKGKLRLCMDYRKLNEQTIKDRGPIPLIADLINTLARGKYFTTLDLRGAYHLLRLRMGDEFKSAFTTKFGQYEFLVLPFGLANAPAAFQRFMNSLFSVQIGDYVLVYLDDIVIFSDDLETHKKQVYEVLQILQDNGLRCSPEKCHFYQTSVRYLGYVISDKGISMDQEKVSAVTDWPTPRNVKELQKFLGFANFYRNLICRYSELTAPLTTLLKKGVEFTWEAEQDQSFNRIKEAFAADNFLAHPVESQPFVLETDASKVAISGVLSQYDRDMVLRPVAFYSRQLNSAERNYEIYDRELLAIIESFHHWRHFLQGGFHKVSVISDHENLKYFMSTKRLNRRQGRWMLFLSEYDFVITHRPGSRQGKSDALSRRPDFGEDADEDNVATLLKPDQISSKQPLELLALNLPPSESQNNMISSPYVSIPFHPILDWPLIIKHRLMSESEDWPAGVPDSVKILCRRQMQYFCVEDNILYRVVRKRKVPYLRHPLRFDEFLRLHKAMAHLKFDSLKDIIKDRFWWPGWEIQVQSWVERCPECQLNNSASGSHVKVPLRPIPPAALPFDRWGMDFVVLPESKSGNRYAITAIDYATRWPVAKAVSDMESGTVASFLHDLITNYGSPMEILTDRGQSFLAEGIQKYIKDIGIKHKLSTPYHPETNGMVERMHAPLVSGIRKLAEATGDRWDEFLDQALFALRIRTHSVTGHSPFKLLYGVEARIPGDLRPPDSRMQPLDEVEKADQSSELLARELDALGQDRAAAYERSRRQAEKMRKKHNLNPDAPEYFFKINDWVKLKHHSATKMDFKWKGPYTVVDVGFPGTYWIMDSRGRRLNATVNERDLAPWLAPVKDNIDYFYDGTSRSTHQSLQGG
jgi:transposase InsO family protein